MKFYRLIEVWSGTQRAENVFNDEAVARAEFESVSRNPFVNGARLYEAEFVDGKLRDKECVAEYLK